MMNEFAKFSSRIEEVYLKMLRSIEGEKYTTPEVLSGIGLILAATVETVPTQKEMVLGFLRMLPDELKKRTRTMKAPNKDEVN